MKNKKTNDSNDSNKTTIEPQLHDRLWNIEEMLSKCLKELEKYHEEEKGVNEENYETLRYCLEGVHSMVVRHIYYYTL